MKLLNKLFALLLLSVLLFSCTEEVKKRSKRPSVPSAPTEDVLVTIHTKFGDIKAILFRETPLHRENFMKLIKKEFYDGTTFHRVIPDFMIQGGDPNSQDTITTNDGQGGPGYTLPAEIKPTLKHKFGALAAARTGGPQNPEKRSSGSQFYIVEKKQGTPFLDNEYTVFGQVVEGLDIITEIGAVETGTADRPLESIEMAVEVETLSVKELQGRYGKDYNKQ